MVNLLLLIKNISDYSKKDVDKGETPLDVYILCSCIREAFCLSYAIRKENNLYFYFQKKYTLIKFKGNKLRYLGPDERSQALLLEKALIKANQNDNFRDKKLVKSTPGIFVKRFVDDVSFFSFYCSIVKGKSYLIITSDQNVKEEINSANLNDDLLELMEDNFYIIPTYSISKENSKIIELFKELKNIKILSLSKIKSLENKILYLNYRKDQLGNRKK
ncbi:hypothetical protein LCGC14_1402240 [marine sediment metagenome]|uniref:Uncharacterized protein n=1 Tax=marine sediment metagenome TaxID=412755 RepID=A0A0F9KHM9_9ZZZZ